MRTTIPSRPSVLILAAVLGLTSNVGRSQTVRLDSPLVQEFQVQGGGAYSGSLELVNSSQQNRQVRIYQQDYFRHTPDRIQFTDAGQEPHARSNIAWVSLSTSLVTLGPGEKRGVEYRIQVPPQGAVTNSSGTYWSSIMAEAVEDPQSALDAGATAQGYRVSIQPVFRTGTLVVTQFPTEGQASVSFVDLRVTDSEKAGAAKLVIDLRNDGLSSLRPRRMWAEFFDLDGTKRAEVDLAEAPIILPNNVYRRYVDLANLEIGPGDYRCLIVVDAGESELFGTQAQIRIPRGRS